MQLLFYCIHVEPYIWDYQIDRDHSLGNIYPLFAWEFDCSSSRRPFRDLPLFLTQQEDERRDSFFQGRNSLILYCTE